MCVLVNDVGSDVMMVVYIGLGVNFGDVCQILKDVVVCFVQQCIILIFGKLSLYCMVFFEVGGDDYYNCVVKFDMMLLVCELFVFCQKIEYYFGCECLYCNVLCMFDFDILLFGVDLIDEFDLIVLYLCFIDCVFVFVLFVEIELVFDIFVCGWVDVFFVVVVDQCVEKVQICQCLM